MPDERPGRRLGVQDAQRLFRGKDGPMGQPLLLHLLLQIFGGVGAPTLETVFEPEARLEKRLWAWPLPAASQHLFIDPGHPAPLEVSAALAEDLGAPQVTSIHDLAGYCLRRRERNIG